MKSIWLLISIIILLILLYAVNIFKNTNTYKERKLIEPETSYVKCFDKEVVEIMDIYDCPALPAIEE